MKNNKFVEKGAEDLPRPPPGPDRVAERMRNAAFHYLQRYASSRANLLRVLTAKLRRWQGRDGFELEAGVAEAAIAAAVADCERLGFIDDVTYAASRVASGERRGLSRSKIAVTLAQKGVDRDTATAAIREAEIDDASAAMIFARRKRLGPFRLRHSADLAKDRSRDMAALCRAGFSARIAARIVDMTPEEIEEAGRAD